METVKLNQPRISEYSLCYTYLIQWVDLLASHKEDGVRYNF